MATRSPFLTPRPFRHWRIAAPPREARRRSACEPRPARPPKSARPCPCELPSRAGRRSYAKGLVCRRQTTSRASRLRRLKHAGPGRKPLQLRAASAQNSSGCSTLWRYICSYCSRLFTCAFAANSAGAEKPGSLAGSNPDSYFLRRLPHSPP